MTPVTPIKKRARAHIAGEILFRVQHEHGRPFTVRTGRSIIEDIGTAFDVYKKPESTLITVAEGRIKVRSQTDPSIQPEFHRLQQIEVSDINGHGTLIHVLPSLTNENLSKLLAWSEAHVDLSHMPLADSIEFMNRRHGTHFVFYDPSIANMEVGGNVNMENFTADDFLKFIEMTFEVHHEAGESPDGQPVIILTRDDTSSPHPLHPLQ